MQKLVVATPRLVVAEESPRLLGPGLHHYQLPAMMPNPLRLLRIAVPGVGHLPWELLNLPKPNSRCGVM